MMKSIVTRLVLTAIVAASFTALPACPKEEPPKVEEPPPPPPPRPPPPTAAIPDYAPTGDDAEWKKTGAAGVTADNAVAKAAEAEGMLDQAIKDLEAAKAAAPAPKK
jgi:hypothetical protein